MSPYIVMGDEEIRPMAWSSETLEISVMSSVFYDLAVGNRDTPLTTTKALTLMLG